jgi:hypothetical protein
VRKLVAPLVLFSLAAVLMGAGAAVPVRANGAAPHVLADAQLTLKLTSTTPGVTFIGNTLVCPAVEIATSSGRDPAPCEFTIESTGGIQPDSVEVTMTAAGITPAEASARKFAIEPRPRALVYLRTAPQTIYRFTGAQLPATVEPGVVWGTGAGTALDNSDLGTTIVVTYSVVAIAVGGATGTPATPTPFVSVGGATSHPSRTSTPPPTASASESSSNNSTPFFALLTCLLLAAMCLTVVYMQRRSIDR